MLVEVCVAWLSASLISASIRTMFADIGVTAVRSVLYGGSKASPAARATLLTSSVAVPPEGLGIPL